MKEQQTEKEPLRETAVVCCGNLEKMNINWMVLEDGTRLMPHIQSLDSEEVKLRVNHCPNCGAYVRYCTIKP